MTWTLVNCTLFLAMTVLDQSRKLGFLAWGGPRAYRWIASGWLVCAPIAAWHLSIADRRLDSVTPGRASRLDRHSGGSTSTVDPTALAKRFVALVKASPASDARLAFLEVYGSQASLREPSVRIALRVVGRRELAAGSTIGSSRMREALSFTIAGAEALWRGADLPADYELAADAFVTAGDATQVLGDLEWSVRCWQSAKAVYTELLEDDSLGNAYRGRIERKLQRTDDDIRRCSSLLEDPSEPAPPPSPTIARATLSTRS